MWVSSPDVVFHFADFGNGATCCFDSVHAMQSGFGVRTSTLKLLSNFRSNNFCSPEYPKCQCHVSQLRDSHLTNVWQFSGMMGVYGIGVGFHTLSDILYRWLLILFPVATCLPSAVMRVIIPPLLVYWPLAASHLPNKIKLFGIPGTCRMFFKIRTYSWLLHVDINLTVPFPAIIASCPPTPVTVLFPKVS